jgi:predicted DNA-binding protein
MTKEDQVLETVQKNHKKKITVSFSISAEMKKRLYKWCIQKKITQSSAIEALIEDSIPWNEDTQMIS